MQNNPTMFGAVATHVWQAEPDWLAENTLGGKPRAPAIRWWYMPEAGISADGRARRPPCPIPHDNPRGSRSCSSRPARACNGRTPFRAIAGAVPTLPREGRTQMSPTLSIVGFVGGSRSSAAHAGLGARRQMRRHARQLADRVDAAEATSSCAWFCAWSSSQSSSPRTSSSIWLSSPYCPP